MTTKQELMEQYLQKMNINIRKPFRCLNPEHEDVHPSMSYNKKTGYVHCFACGANYDVYNLVEILEGIQGFPAQKSHIESSLNLPLNDGTIPASTIKTQKISNNPHSSSMDLTGYLMECQGNLSQKAIEYLQSRGLTMKTIEEAMIGEDPYYYIGSSHYDMITIPYGKDLKYYLARSIDDKIFAKPENTQERIFHQDAFDQETAIITESPICALSIEQETGRRCAALSGVGYNRIIEYLEKTKKHPFILLCMDNDERGTQALLSFQKELKAIGVESLDVRKGNPFKDPNEFLQADPEGFREWCQNLPEKPINTHSLKWILRTWDQREEPVTFKTGWKKLDSSMKLHPGIYILGGISSAGKTTWMLQTAWKMSEWSKVVYCSLEQTETVLVQGLLRGHSREELMDGSRDFSVYYVEGFKEIQRFIRENKNTVIVVDYLQMLATGQGVKDKIDGILAEFKRLALKNDNLVWMISSLNRTNYYRMLDFESFKESGGIEYNAEGVLGIQYRVVHSKIFGSDGNFQQKREALHLEKGKNPRQMELVCLKDKYGKGIFEVSLDFFVDTGLFKEKEGRETAVQRKDKRI